MAKRPQTPNMLQVFRTRATSSEWETLAWYADTSTEYLRQLAMRYCRRTPSVVMAYRIEHGTRALERLNRKLPVVTAHSIAEMILDERN